MRLFEGFRLQHAMRLFVMFSSAKNVKRSSAKTGISRGSSRIQHPCERHNQRRRSQDLHALLVPPARNPQLPKSHRRCGRHTIGRLVLRYSGSGEYNGRSDKGLF